MDKNTNAQLVRQLKILNFWITTFGVLLLLALAIIGFFLYQTVMFVRSTSDKISSFQEQTSQQLDVKRQVCEGAGGFSDFIRGNTNACN